jgi:hypothetical protein
MFYTIAGCVVGYVVSNAVASAMGLTSHDGYGSGYIRLPSERSVLVSCITIMCGCIGFGVGASRLVIGDYFSF